MDKVIILGGGAHCRSVLESVICSKCFEPVGIIDPKFKADEPAILSVNFLDNKKPLLQYRKEGIEHAVIGVGSKGDNTVRARLFKEAKAAGFTLPVIRHKTAYVSSFSKIGTGTQLMANSVVNSNSELGSNCVLNSLSVVEHDCLLKDNIFTGPGVVICGGTTIGSNSFLGANATVVPDMVLPPETFLRANSLYHKKP